MSAGLNAAHARGRKGGRPKVLEPAKRQLVAELYAEQEWVQTLSDVRQRHLRSPEAHTIGEICRMMGISKPTVYNYIAEATNDMRRQRPSDETLMTLRGRLEDLPARSPERQRLAAQLTKHPYADD